jgi:hypothetical protein
VRVREEDGGRGGRVGPGALERLTGGASKEKQCSNFQFQKLLLPRLQKSLKIYWRKIKLPKT